MTTPEEDGLEASSPSTERSEEEPRLKFAPLCDETSPRAQSACSTRLCVSNDGKVLALGHQNGVVVLLDCLGNQIKVFKEHRREVTDLSFDASGEFLASAAADGTIAVHGLYSEEVARIRSPAPVTTLCLDPRYGSRKTRELVYGTAGGALILSSKGWLGNRETPLFTGKGPLRCARMSGTLLAWATDSGLRVYDTATHSRLGKLPRPAAVASDPAAPCSMLWRGERELFVAWGCHVSVLRVGGSLLPTELGPAPGRSLQVVAAFDAGVTLLGAAPFGADLAVLAWGSPADSLPTSSAATPVVLSGSTTAAEEAPSVPAGQLAAPGADQAAAAADQGEAAEAAEQRGGAAQSTSEEGAPAQPAETATTRPEAQELSLCFYSRSGQLLAVDALGCSCSAAERRWHQLAFTYPGDADLRLAAAVPPALASGTQPVPTPPGSSAGSQPGSAAGSSVGTPIKQAPPSQAGLADGAPPSTTTAAVPGDGSQPQDGTAPVSPAESSEQPAVQGYKWWSDGEEPAYFVSTPTAVIVGRPRDGDDRVGWLSDRGRYAEALSIAEEDVSVTVGVRDAVGEQYLQALVEAGQYQEAAALCPRVLKGNALAWERWAFTFAQLRALPALAPHLPTQEPQLKASTYDLVLSSALLHSADHAVLLRLVKSWPPQIYGVEQLQASLLQRMSGGGDWPLLQEAAAHLHTQQGRYEDALRLLLQLRSPAAFDYIARHALVDRVSPFAAALLDLDEVRATALLVEHSEEVPPGDVVAALQDAAAASPDAPARQRWRRRLHAYLDWLFQRDSQLGAAFAELQVELYAEFEPSRLLHFLMLSPSYPLERAYQVCEERGLVREMVYVLGRMGSAEKALRLIVEGLRDVVQAVEYVQLQRDDDLWEQLIALTLGDAQLTGALLDHAGGYIDPLRVVSAIPPHLAVDNLRGRLVKIITDFRTQMSLQQGCNTILRHDCVVLANRLHRVLRSCLRRLHLKLQNSGGSRWVLYDCLTGEEAAEDDAAEALLAGGAGTDAATSAHGERGTPSPKPGPASTTPGMANQQQQQQRVWVGLLGAPPAAAADDAAARQQQASRSPSKFVRLASPPVQGNGGLAPRRIALAS